MSLPFAKNLEAGQIKLYTLREMFLERLWQFSLLFLITGNNITGYKWLKLEITQSQKASVGKQRIWIKIMTNSF